MFVGFDVLNGLHVHEDEAKDKRQRQKRSENAALAGEQCVMRDGHRNATREQDGCINQWQTERTHHLVVTADFTGTVGWPRCFVAFP